MATEAQIAANRANAQHSTGPVTEAGKARARFNALQGGLHARLAVLPGESEEELDILRLGIVKALCPVGLLELMLVDRIVTLLWRQQRGLAAERGVYAALEGDSGLRTLRALGCVAPDDGAAAPDESGLRWKLGAMGALDHLHRWEDRLDRAVRHAYRLLEREQAFRYEAEKELLEQR